ncbi:MAG TPA: 16S rRNA (cytosine(1402)-N(4))-methyltransferase RsmH [Saprospiraceae bacterium]|nr:16S rRNA (cytosine(1402)-N(4))-methyltransferase RsmH [Saprospiraceae bacterium]
MQAYHIPVLLNESISSLNVLPDGVYVDATFGAGGHSKPILTTLNAKGHLYAFDQDDDAFDNAFDQPNFTLIQANYRYLHRFMKLYGVEKIDGILADLGISSHQIDVPERGFSFRYQAPLDMRMNTSSAQTARDILATYPEDDLTGIFSDYGEVRNAITLAKKIVEVRKSKKIDTTDDLNAILRQCAMGPAQKYFAQVYQALRIEVNDEMNALIDFLQRGKDLLKPGGRFAVITYHSLEDRLVKNLFKTGNVTGDVIRDAFGNIERPFELYNKNVIVPSSEEQRINPRSRSAKLRVAIKR